MQGFVMLERHKIPHSKDKLTATKAIIHLITLRQCKQIIAAILICRALAKLDIVPFRKNLNHIIVT